MRIQSSSDGLRLFGDPTQGQEMLVFAEQSLGAVVRTFHIEHFRPAELTLQAWEQRGLLLAPE